jgi:peptide/nickel transport system ATP-binding protein
MSIDFDWSVDIDTYDHGGRRKYPSGQAPILQVEDLAISYQTRQGEVAAVRDVSFDVQRGEAFGILGESGCGKSSVALGILNFLGKNGRIVRGRILFHGYNLVGRPQEELRYLRGDQMAMVYQDPVLTLNPSMRLGDQMAEVLIVHRKLERKEAEQRCQSMLERVYMPDPANVMRRYPHQVSGGQKQRVVIAMALLNDPLLLIMDEPTSALDVTVEAAVLDLIAELQEELETAILYISHNLGVVARVSNQIGVMYAGEIVERATVEAIYLNPFHPYTRGLMRCAPQWGMDWERRYLYPIPGRVPSPTNLPPGCSFEPRCPHARQRCRAYKPDLREIEPRHWARCHFVRQIAQRRWQAPQQAQPTPLAQPRPAETTTETLLKVAHARTYYRAPARRLFRRGRRVRAVDDVSLVVKRGQTLGIVGESGCGKSTLARTIIGLEEPSGGEFEFLGLDISRPVSRRGLALIREIQMVFQNPDSTLNPAYTVGAQIARPLRRFKTVPQEQVRAEVLRLLDLMKLGQDYYERLPRQLSGGEKQRVGIARAIAGRPELLLCDEPVSALDVSVQAAVLNLLMDIQGELGTTLVFIAHDLSVVRLFCDQVAVMYLGQIAEIGPAEAIYAPPYHPYTEALLAAVPIPDPTMEQERVRLSGKVPSALDPPGGCRFHTRCPRRKTLAEGGKICEVESPPWREAGGGHRIYCHIPLETLRQVETVVVSCNDV